MIKSMITQIAGQPSENQSTFLDNYLCSAHETVESWIVFCVSTQMTAFSYLFGQYGLDSGLQKHWIILWISSTLDMLWMI